jgi:hypothetical protein
MDAINLENDSRRSLGPLILAVVVAAAVMAAAWSFYPQWSGDANAYILIAQGNLAQVNQPWSSRFLHPYAARALTHVGVNTVGLAFALLAVASLLTLVAFVAAIAQDQCRRLWILGALLFSPTLIDLYRYAFLPDLFHAALAAVFFWLMLRDRRVGMLAMIPLMFFTREATILLGAIAAIVLWRRKERRIAIAVACVTFISMLISARIAAHGKPNIHGISPLMYTVGKVPFNFLKNVLAVEGWTNTFSYAPAWKMTLPHALQFGKIREVGLRGFNPSLPLTLLLQWMVTFGVLPLLLWRVLRQRRRQPASAAAHAAPVAIDIALVYGLVSFAAAPALGASLGRLVTYAWPAFWIAAVWLYFEGYRPTLRQWCILIACHQALLWIAWLPTAFNSQVGGLLITLALAALLYAFAWWRTGHVLQTK